MDPRSEPARAAVPAHASSAQSTPEPPNGPPSVHGLEPWVRRLAVWLDAAFLVPGTQVRVGFDPILGVIAPGLGDALGAALSVSMLFFAWRERAPANVLVRMAGNIAADLLVGAVPVLGDLADVFLRSNLRNLALLDAHRAARGLAGNTAPPARASGPLLALLLTGILAVILPILALGLGITYGAVLALSALLAG